MKKRNRKKENPFVSDEEMEEYIDKLVKGEQFFDTIETDFGPLSVLKQSPWQKEYKEYLKIGAEAYWKKHPLMHRRRMKIKRRNGKVETYIIFNDGSIHDSNIPLTKMKKGDKVISQDGI